MAIRKCPDCGFNKIQSTLVSVLPRFLTFLLPLQAGECVKCQRPRIQVIWYKIPVKLLVWILIFGAFFVLGKSVGKAHPLVAKTFMKQLSRYRIQELIPPKMIKKADGKEIEAKEAEIDSLLQKISTLESEVIQYENQFTALESQLSEPNLKDDNKGTVNHSNPTPTNMVTEDEIQFVLKSVERWRMAWQSQNVEAYLAHYTDEFGNSNRRSRKAWIKDRKFKLTVPKIISVTIENVRLKRLNTYIWEVTFRQVYQSNLYKSEVTKTLTLKKVGNRYLIDEERS